MSGIIDDIEEVEKDGPDVVAAAEDVASAIEDVSSSSKGSTTDVITRIEGAMQDLLKHIADLISNHSK